MSAAAAAATDANEAPAKKKGLSKKLLLIVGGLVLVLGLGGGAAVYFMKKKAAEAAAAAEEEGGDVEAAQAADKPKKKDAQAVPTFLPIDAFVVNLADRDQERFAQIGVTLQVVDPKAAEQLKLYMPAIRNGVLMVLAHKTSAELLERAGKEKLAREIMREAVRPLGIEIEAEAEDDEPADAKPAAKKKRKPAAEPSPVEHVHFSSFIIQ
ncbi:MAG TPA: flagellar basal body-associated FliL family protein [Methylibium sp.]|uniref:flagellar basal body-associated FliL family protein n=1 Tax=Methylibium sp. TaxID=2067992 RepID=UPI002DBE3458|nr:flagellar basal body-associated FliL family protein [Methylibium sp.]HEU4458608.1 flagellar basal body-associated FliL family protein [Methylibium sp.]